MHPDEVWWLIDAKTKSLSYNELEELYNDIYGEDNG